MSKHATAHPKAGQIVTLHNAGAVNGNSRAAIKFRIEDWNDRVFGETWMLMAGHPASLAYAVRAATGRLPVDNEVVYGKVESGIGHLVHVSEIQTEATVS